MLRMARHVHEETRQREPLPGRRRGAELRRQRPDCSAKGRSRTSGSSRPPATRAARSARPCSSTIACSNSRARSGSRRTACSGSSSARPSPTTRSSEFLDSAGAVYTAPGALTRRSAETAQLLADEKVVGWFQGRMEFGPRALGARSIIGDPRSHQDAVGDEPEDQVPRKLPAVRAERAARARRTSTSRWTADSPYMLLVAPVAKARRRQMSDAKRATCSASTSSTCRARHPGGHARGLFGPRADGRPAKPIPPITSCSREFKKPDRLPGARQHQLQRARRADRVHPQGRLSLLHAHRDGRPRLELVRPAESRSTGVDGRRGLAAPVRPGLRGMRWSRA